MTFRSSQLGKFNLSRYVFVLQSLQSTEFLIIISILEKNTKQLCHRYYYIKTGVGPMLKMEYFNIRNKYPADGGTILYIISCKINVRGAHACGITLNCLRRGPRIHRSTTENFCWDEIRPRDWLNVDVGIFGHAPSIILSTTTTGQVRAALRPCTYALSNCSFLFLLINIFNIDIVYECIVLRYIVENKLRPYLHYLLTIGPNTKKINCKHKRNCSTQPDSVYRTDTGRKLRRCLR